MSWPLRYRSDPEPWKDAQIGDCWYYPNWEATEHPYPMLRQHFLDFQASHQYREQWANKRAPIVVQLPPGFAFSPDEKYGWPQGNPQHEGWTVTGSPEDGTLVVSPSVNVVGTYHGWINDGHVSGDVEGRTFT